jgi:hypothetical protein
VAPAAALRYIRSAKIALVTDKGLVSKGNPDKIEAATATRYGRYDIAAKDALDPADYEVNHRSYDSRLVSQDPNRLVPVDVMREMEREGVIGALHDWFYNREAGIPISHPCFVTLVAEMVGSSRILPAKKTSAPWEIRPLDRRTKGPSADPSSRRRLQTFRQR